VPENILSVLLCRLVVEFFVIFFKFCLPKMAYSFLVDTLRVGRIKHLSRGSYPDNSGTWEEYTTEIFFEVTDTGFQCNPSLPCLSHPCSSIANSVCTVEAVSGLPTAHCTCDTGYEDDEDDDNKAAAGGALSCTNIDECADGIHLCAETQVMKITGN